VYDTEHSSARVHVCWLPACACVCVLLCDCVYCVELVRTQLFLANNKMLYCVYARTCVRAYIYVCVIFKHVLARIRVCVGVRVCVLLCL